MGERFVSYTCRGSVVSGSGSLNMTLVVAEALRPNKLKSIKCFSFFVLLGKKKST